LPKHPRGRLHVRVEERLVGDRVRLVAGQLVHLLTVRDGLDRGRDLAVDRRHNL
jgi:hypothetical protein